MNIKRWIPLLLLLSLLVGCGEEPAEVEPSPTPVQNETTAPVATPVRTGVTILADGVIQSAQPALPLAFETGGKLLALHVQAGAVVQEGDLIATLDDSALQEAIANATLQIDQSTNALAQAQLDLDNLLNWEADELAVAQAQSNLAAAESALANAESQDAVAGNSATQTRISVDQAERAVTDAQKAYDIAHEHARDWELDDPYRSDALKAERDGTTRNLAFAQEQLVVARANYALAIGGINNDTAVSAEANVAAAQQALDQVLSGPKDAEIEAVQLRVIQVEIALAQSELGLSQAQNALADAQLVAPWTGTVASLEATPGALVGSGTPIVTVLDLTQLEFHTTNLSERDLGQIYEGQSAEITLKAYPAAPIVATVSRIGLQAGAAVGDAATFPLVLILHSTDLDIRPGMTGRVDILRVEQ